MLSLPERHPQNCHWVYAGQLLMAAATDKGVSMHEAQQQLSIALKAEGLVWAPTQNGPANGAESGAEVRARQRNTIRNEGPYGPSPARPRNNRPAA
jgi:hypothetical protein